jgi:glycosyltransferase involved in cell wall biosynthesis
VTRVCFFGAYDREYPRNRILRAGLERCGVEVREVRTRERRAWLRYPALAAAFARRVDGAGILLVPEFRHKDMPLARLLAGRRMLVFDPLVSRHDTLVGDWEIHARGSLQARWNRWIDRWALSLADLVLCDTWAHGALYESLGARRERLARVLVGAEDAFFRVGPPEAAPPVRIVYLGGFLPLHGIPFVLEALASLERRSAGLPPYQVVLAGRGIDFGSAVAFKEQKKLERVEFTGAIPYADAPRVVASAHVVLGAFGAGEKAGRVIPHKVYQGLAAGRAVLTGDGPGLREVFEPGVHLAAVPRGDAEAIAEALGDLIGSASRRLGLGEAGRRRALEVATPERVGESLLQALERTGRAARADAGRGRTGAAA